MAYTFQSELGTGCQQRAQAQVPICVITTLQHDELLFAHVPVGGGGATWVIQSVVCSIQRFWNASTATINITCNATDSMAFPTPLPTITNPEDDITHQLGPEDNICIWMGYVDTLFVDGASLISMMEGDSPKLMRVFVGVVDTLGVVGTDNGYKYTLQCRDRMRYLMDTQVSLSPFNINNDRSAINLALGGRTESVDRSDTILKLAQLGVGHIDLAGSKAGETDLNGLRINKGLIADLGKLVKPPDGKQVSGADMVTPGAMPPIDYFYNYDNAPLAGKTKTLNLNLEMFPKFNIITSRLPFSTENVAKEFTIEQQIPIELIKWLSNQESYPTEVFNSPSDGNFYYVPRSADISGLADPKRFFRTYYYRFQPEGLGDKELIESLEVKYPTIEIETNFNPTVDPSEVKSSSAERAASQTTRPEPSKKDAPLTGAAANLVTFKPVVEVPTPPTPKLVFEPVTPFKYKPDWAQGIINWREESSTNAMYTNYLIANNSPNNVKDSQIILMHLTARPPFLAGRSIAGRTMYVVDETIANSTEARSVGLQLARIHSKETRSASMTLIGDPTLTPGEIIQAIGSPLHQELNNLDTIIGERVGAVDYLKREAFSYQDTLAKIKGYSPENERVLLGNGSNDAGKDNPSPSGEFPTDPMDKSHTVAGKTLANSTEGSVALIRHPLGKDNGIMFTPNTDPNEKVSSGNGIAPDPNNATSTTPAATTSGVGTAGTSTDAEQSQMVFPYSKPWPTISSFGMRVHPITGGRRFHAGYDIAASSGTPFLAALKGVVTTAGWLGGYGNTVIIDHGNGLSSLYGHASKVLVATGQQVTTGQSIGLTGSTGQSTGPHLHFELRTAQGAVDVTYMPFKKGYTPTQAEIKARLDLAKSSSSTVPTSTSAAKATAQSLPTLAKPATKASGKQVTPVKSATTTPTTKYVNTLVLRRTGRINEFGLEDLTLTIYNSQGVATFTCTANSGIKGRQQFGTANNDRAGLKYPLPFGTYSVGSPEASSEPGVGGTFIRLTPSGFRTGRSALGIHWDEDRFVKLRSKPAPEPGSAGCLAVTTQSEFNLFRSAFVASGARKMIFANGTEAAPTPTPNSSTTSVSTSTQTPTSVTAQQELPPPVVPQYEDGEWKKSHYNQDPQSLFRIEAVKHSFNSSGATGYTVEVVLFPIA